MEKIFHRVTIPQNISKLFPEVINTSSADEYARLLLIQKAVQDGTKRILETLPPEDAAKIETWIKEENVSIEFDLSEPNNSESIDFLTVREVSQLLGITPQQVRRNCASGKYDASQVAGENSSWRIKAEQFKNQTNWNNFLKQRKEKFEKNKKAAELGIELWEDELNTNEAQPTD